MESDKKVNFNSDKLGDSFNNPKNDIVNSLSLIKYEKKQINIKNLLLKIEYNNLLRLKKSYIEIFNKEWLKFKGQTEEYRKIWHTNIVRINTQEKFNSNKNNIKKVQFDLKNNNKRIKEIDTEIILLQRKLNS